MKKFNILIEKNSKIYEFVVESYQDKIKVYHKKRKKELIGRGNQPNSYPYTEKPSYERSKSAPPGYQGA